MYASFSIRNQWQFRLAHVGRDFRGGIDFLERLSGLLHDFVELVFKASDFACDGVNLPFKLKDELI